MYDPIVFLFFAGFPSKVRNIKVKKSDSRGTITLSWEPPLEQGGLPRSLKYDVGCGDACKLKFTPSKVNLTKTKVEISGLTPGREYNFTVFSKNIISVLYSNGHLAFENKKFKLPRGKYATRIVRDVATERCAACNPPPPPTHTHICSWVISGKLLGDLS
jgi:hypothetical protein